ncbi:MAG TPA: leucyl aminopeptidase [Candidatus Xenobia bacterium]|nr:leucyl aminopeptidase [Candidatus Xenobia bacterium]
MLDVKLLFDPPEAISTEALVTWTFQPDTPEPSPLPHLLEDLDRWADESPAVPPVEPRLEYALAAFDQLVGGQLSTLAASGELTGKAGETVLLHQPRGFRALRLMILGAGKMSKFSLDSIRQLAGTAARALKARGLTEFAFFLRSLPDGVSAAEAAQAAVEGTALANFDTTRYQTERPTNKIVRTLQLAGLAADKKAELEDATRRGQILGEAQNFARELINEPSNRLTPRIFAEHAAKMAREFDLQADILDENRARELKMGAFLSVAQGSEEPPRMVVLTYSPAGWQKGQPVLGLVGKGITFDSGGISIKPGEGMEKMKYDMAGAATMLGAMRAIAQLKPKIKVIAIMPLTENLPSGKAQKPGDIQVAMSGKTIEVINTDAEGRLVLADAVYYARELGATHIVDAATLTGAIHIALGGVYAGAFTNNQKFFDAFLSSARAAGEKFWPMPLDDDYADNIKSEIADIRNTGKGRGGGAINGALFIQEFVGSTPWIHLDIAGTAWLEEAKPGLAKGPTGIGLRTLVHLAEHFSG